MTDPLSISASVITLLQLSGTVIEYLNGLKGASEDRRRLLDEVTSVSGLLRDVAGTHIRHAYSASEQLRPRKNFTQGFALSTL
jgi:hypothetical protein